MAVSIEVNIYEINGVAVPVQQMLLPAAVQASKYVGNNASVLYSVIKDNLGFTYAIAETIAQLKALANA